MSEHGLTRREASRILLATGLAAGAGLGSAALGQPVVPKQPKKDKSPPKGPAGSSPTPPSPANGGAPSAAPPKSWIDDAMKRGRTHDWVFKPTVHVQAYQEDTARTTGDHPLVIGALKFETAAVMFPVIRGTGSSETDVDEVKSELTFNDRVEEVKPEYNEGYHAGVRLGRWELRNKEGKEVELKLEIPMTSWETIFDEKVAAQAAWPKSGKWPKMAQATLADQDRVDLDSKDKMALKDLLDKWMNGQKPSSMPPLVLAKTLAGKVVETFQPSGNGESYDSHGAFTGLVLPGPAETIRLGKGSPHDIASVLLGVYRAAGLPARLVLAHDESDSKGDDTPIVRKHTAGGVRLRSWVEFCLIDEPVAPAAAPGVAPLPPPLPRELWVPVDPVRMRKRSSQLGRVDQPWRYFGSHDELDDAMPFAFHFIPPTTVTAYGYAFWGWFTTPRTLIGEHWLRFQSQTAVRRPVSRPTGGKPVR